MSVISRKKNAFTDSRNGKVSYFFKVSRPDLEQMDDAQIGTLVQSLKGDIRSLSSNDYCKVYKFGYDVIIGTSNEKFTLTNHVLTPLKSKDLKDILLYDDIFSNAMNCHDCIKLNGEYFRFIRVADYPNMMNLLEVDCFGDYFFQFQPISSTIAKRKLDLQRKQASSTFREAFRNHREEAAFEENEALLEKITFDEETLFNIELWYVIRDCDLDRLNKRTEITLSALSKRNFRPIIETIGIGYALTNFLPGTTPEFKVSSIVHSSCLVNFFPLTEDRLMESGIEFVSRSGRRVHFDNFNEKSTSFSAIIVGPPGSGKSFLGNKLIDFGMSEGRSSLIIDRGGSYKKTTKYHGGVEMEGSFNPLQFKSPDYLITFLYSKVPVNEFTKKEQYETLQEIQELDLSEINTLDQLLNALNTEVSKKLKIYLTEVKPFIKDTNSEIHKINYIDLENYPESILEPLLIYALEYSNHLPKGKYQILMDEAHELLEKFPNFVSKRFREVRKKGGSAIAITQNFGDFINTKIGETIAQNSFHNFFFRQPCSRNQFLDDFDVEAIKNAKSVKGSYSEFFYKSENHRKVLTYIPTLVDYYKFTSNKSDNLNFEKFQSEYGEYLSFKDLIHKYSEVKEVGYEK